MSESLKSKDTQLAVLRVRFEEMDSEIKSKNTEIETLKVESQRLIIFILVFLTKVILF